MKNLPPNPSPRRRLTRHAVLWGACALWSPFASAQLYWNTNGTAGTWTAANWESAAGGTDFTTAWTAESDVVFSADSTVTFATTDIGSVSVADGLTVTVTEAGTLGTGGEVRTFNIGADALLDWSGQDFSTAAGTGFIKSGEGTWEMGSNGNAYGGGFTLNAGTVVVTGVNNFGDGAMQINGGTIQSSGGKDFKPTSLSIGGDFQFTGTGNDIWNMPVDLNGGTRTISQNASGSRTFSGVISNGGLSKAGSGVLTLSGANSYTGKTTVSSGTLALGSGGSIATSAEIEVVFGATLDVSAAAWTLENGQRLTGEGTISGDVTIDGIYAPGGDGGPGTQSITGSLAFGAGSIFEWDLDANSIETGFDTVSVTGDINVSETDTVFRVVFGDGVDMAGDFWSTLHLTQEWSMASIFGEGFSSGAFQSVETSTDVSSYGGFSIDGTNLTWTAVPEPTSALAGLLLGAGLLRRKR